MPTRRVAEHPEGLRIYFSYTVLTQSNAEGSYFKTYVNTNKSITLQVSYNAYAHSSALPSGQAYAFDEPTVRVVSARVNSTHSDYPRVGGYKIFMPKLVIHTKAQCQTFVNNQRIGRASLVAKW